MRKYLLAVWCGLIVLLLNASQAVAFTNNRYLAYGKKVYPLAVIQPQAKAVYAVSDTYITSLVTGAVDKLVAEGLLKGQKGDKGDPGSAGQALGGPAPADGVMAPAPIVYNSNIPGNIAGFTELSAGDFTAGTSLTVSPGAPVEISAGSSLEVDANANFTASTTMGDLNVATIESPSGAYLSSGGDWVNASSRDLKTNLATVTPQTILTEIDSLPIYTWNYKTQNPAATHMGPMAQDFYSTFGLGESSTSISTIDPAGVALAGIQGLDSKVTSLMDISWITNGLKNLGTDIEQGFIKVESLVAGTIQTGQLEVGSPDQPTGITIYDTVTKQPVCVYSANNILQSTEGKCGTANPAPPPTAPPDHSDSQPSPTSTPVVLSPDDAAISSSTINALPPDTPQATSTAPTTPADNTASSTINNGADISSASSISSN